MSECIKCGKNNWKYTLVKGKDRIQKTCNDCNYERQLTHAEANAYCFARESVDKFEELNDPKWQKKIIKDEKKNEIQEHKDLVWRAKKWAKFDVEKLKVVFKCACYLDDIQNGKNTQVPKTDPFILEDIIEEIQFIGREKEALKKEQDGVRA